MIIHQEVAGAVFPELELAVFVLAERARGSRAHDRTKQNQAYEGQE
jgi:hypothetical protein